MTELSLPLETTQEIKTDVEYNSLLNELWQLVDQSNTAVKLVLPDSIRGAFYLPRVSKRDKDAIRKKIDREHKRTLFLCEKASLEGSASSPRRKVEDLIPRDVVMQGKAQTILKRLVDPYREDEEKRKALFLRVKELKSDSELKKSQSPRPFPLPAELRKSSVLVSASTNERMRRASERRATLSLELAKSLENLDETWKIKLQAIEKNDMLSGVEVLRSSMWLRIIVVLNTMKSIAKAVAAQREVKAQNPARWKAAMRIQRFFRRWYARTRPRFKVSSAYGSGKRSSTVMLKHLKKRMGAADKSSIYTDRVNAATLITKFLITCTKEFKFHVRTFIRKIKILQMHIRGHQLASQARCDLVARLLDALLPVLIAHINVVLSDRGYDYKNISSFDLSKIKTANLVCMSTTIGSRPILQKLLDDMQTGSFHSLLRSATARVEVCRFMFSPFTKAFAAIGWKQKKPAILDFLFIQRKKKLERLRKADVVVLNIPTFSNEDIKLFIRGGPDPLSTYLETSRLGNNTSCSDEQRLRTENKVVGRDGRVMVQGKRWSEVTLCVLKHATLEEILTLFLDIGDLHIEAQKELKAKLHENAKRSKLSSPNPDSEQRDNSRNINSPLAVVAHDFQDVAAWELGTMEEIQQQQHVHELTASVMVGALPIETNKLSFPGDKKMRNKSMFINNNNLGNSMGGRMGTSANNNAMPGGIDARILIASSAALSAAAKSSVSYRPSTPPGSQQKPSNRRKQSFVG